jgi:hypothetical protein
MPINHLDLENSKSQNTVHIKMPQQLKMVQLNCDVMTQNCVVLFCSYKHCAAVSELRALESIPFVLTLTASNSHSALTLYFMILYVSEQHVELTRDSLNGQRLQVLDVLWEVSKKAFKLHKPLLCSCLEDSI